MIYPLFNKNAEKHTVAKQATILQPKVPGADSAAAQASALRALHRLLVIHPPAAWNTVRLVDGARADNTAVFGRPREASHDQATRDAVT